MKDGKKYCHKCNIRLIHGLMPLEEGKSVNIYFCPKCHHRYEGEIESDKEVHIEPEYFIKILLSDYRLSKEQMLTIK